MSAFLHGVEREGVFAYAPMIRDPLAVLVPRVEDVQTHSATLAAGTSAGHGFRCVDRPRFHLNLPSARILIVEDDGELLEVLQFVLEDAGYKVTVASNGADALKSVQSGVIDLVVLDVGLAEMSGLDVARALRSGADSAHVRIALHTGLEEEAIRADFSDYDAFMPKGDDADELLKLISTVLSKKRPGDPAAEAAVLPQKTL